MLFNRNAFRTLMEVRQVRQQDIANITGLSAAYVSQLANGDRLDPTIDTLRRVAEALEIQPESLYVPTATVRFWCEKHADVVLGWIGADRIRSWLRDHDRDHADAVAL